MSKGVRLYFIRHGETILNYYGKMQGWSDAPLTEEGEVNVRKSGRGLSDVKFDAVYTSDLTRTIKTAQLLLSENEATDKDIEMTAMPEFREVFFGSMEGRLGEDVWEDVAEELGYASTKELFTHTDVPERLDGLRKIDPYDHAEDFMTFWSRIEKGLLKIINKHRDTEENVLLVAHGGTIRYMLTGLVPELEDPESLLNASVTVADYVDGQFQLSRYNDVSHFEEIEESEVKE